ncbi:MAG: 23S rRNA (adenine(2503)-C(2))-methyltransferase RlmN [Nibricoccus sp.]
MKRWLDAVDGEDLAGALMTALSAQSVIPLDLYDLTKAELQTLIVGWGLSPVHTARLWNYLYWECVDSFAAMRELPPKLQARLQADCVLGVLPVAVETHSSDGFTRKYLLALSDQEKIETVLMRFSGRVTACISSQAGCAMGCVFCATGQRGFTRHLTTGEIVAQVVHVQRILKAKGERLRNLVLMGMGEPLHNYDAVMKAVDIFRDSSGLAIGASKITLSTVGVIPGIIRLADEGRTLSLALSLHGATQEERHALVPTAKRWPLDELMDACRYYVKKTGQKIFFEWTLIEGKNDSEENAHAVARLLKGLEESQVNLIPLNPTSGYAGAPTRTEAAKRFQAVLAEYGFASTVRQRRGIDIAAGCGQLAAIS